MSLALFLEADLQCGNGAASQWIFCRGTTTSQCGTKEQDAGARQGKDACARALKRATDDSSFTRPRTKMNVLDPIPFKRLLPLGAGNKDAPKMVLTAEHDGL